MTEVLLEMLKYYGLKEVLGPQNNQQIVDMFHDIGFEWVQDDETSWCSAALNYFCKKCSYERSGKLDARSWLKLPTIVLKPELGDVVIFWRINPNSWEGHVGLYINSDDKYVYVLGGNQSGTICVSPYNLSRVLGYRRAKKIK
jgi:uncharacterized protein (TIGR02594 family)